MEIPKLKSINALHDHTVLQDIDTVPVMVEMLMIIMEIRFLQAWRKKRTDVPVPTMQLTKFAVFLL